MVTTTAWANYCGRVLPIPPCQHSLWEETGVPGENPRFSAERWLYSFHMRTGFDSTLLGIELGTLEVKGEWSDHYTTEAPDTTEAPVVKNLSKIQSWSNSFPPNTATNISPGSFWSSSCLCKISMTLFHFPPVLIGISHSRYSPTI